MSRCHYPDECLCPNCEMLYHQREEAHNRRFGIETEEKSDV